MPGFKIPFQNDCPPLEQTGPSNVVETARQHRYSLEILEPFGDRENGLLMFLNKCTRPNVEFDEVLVHSAQDEITRPGKTHFKSVDFSFYEILRGEGKQRDQSAELIYKWWSSTMVDIKTSLHRSPSEYLKNCQLSMLDGDGSIVWTYSLYDCWPSKVSPSDLDYSSSEISTISVTLRYSKHTEGV